MTAMNLCALACGIVMALPVTAAAQVTPLSITMDGAVALQAAVLAEGTLTEAQVQVLKDIAHQKAVVLTCEGFALDGTRMAEILADAYPSDDVFGALDEAAQIQLRSVMMLVMGTFLGGNLAIAATDPDAWCAAAEIERARTDAPNQIWAD
jgi:hypothetical protein